MVRIVEKSEGLGRVAVSVLALLVGLVVVADVQAEEESGHNDVLVFQSGGKVFTGGIDVDCFSGVGPAGCDPNGALERVFEAELAETGSSPGIIGAADEPGFFSVPDGGEFALPFGDNLPAAAVHAVDFIIAPSGLPQKSILFWDGTGGFVNWSGVPNSEIFDIEGNAGSGGILNGGSELLGVLLDSPGANGTFDTHPEFFLNGGGGQDPTNGFYALIGRTNVSELASSDPWAIVFDFGVENEELHEAAIDSLAYVLPVPEPTGLTLLASVLVGLALARRRSA